MAERAQGAAGGHLRPTGKREQARAARERIILDTAREMFYARGVHEVGMDELVAATGLSKPAVYRTFPSKDVLIGAYLMRLSDTILDLVDDSGDRLGSAAALHGVLDAVEADLARPTFRGCPFNNASVEFPDPDHPARQAARHYREQLHQRLTELATDLAAELALGDNRVLAGRLADELAVLIDGVYVNAVHLGTSGPTRAGLALGHRLIDQLTHQLTHEP